MSKENNLTPYLQMIKHKVRGKTVPGRIENVMEELSFVTKTGQTPVMVKKTKTDYGWHLIYHLPAGISSKDIENKLHYFEEQAGGAIQIKRKGATLLMSITTKELPRKVGYSFAPDPKMLAAIPIGHTATGPLIVDLADIPHLFVGGTPGSGKSNFLHVMANSLLQQGVITAIVDLKKLEFAYLRNKAILASDVSSARELLRLLNVEMDKRIDKLEAANCVKVQDYKGEDMPYIVAIFDELAEMQDQACQEYLNRIVRLSRAAGISVVCATQRPSSTTWSKFGDTKAMFSGTVCFRVRDAVNSRIILDNDRGTEIPKDIPGRAIWQWDDEVMVQTMFLPVSQAKQLVKDIKPPKGVEMIESRQVRLPPR